MNTSTLSVSSILLSFLFLSACGGGGHDEININDEIFGVRDQKNSLTKSLEGAYFKCVSSDCPMNVGLLATSSSGYSLEGQCSAFLIADDIVATNSHCIPDSLKSDYYTPDCSKYLAIRFQPQPGKKEIFECQTVLSYSDYKNDSGGQDYAFFKLSSSTGRKPFPIHKKGIKDNQSLTIKKVSPMTYTFGGRLAVQKCRNALNSFVNMDATNPWSTSGAVIDCSVIGGNSGSPIVNEAGSVVGIAQAYWTDTYINSLRKSLDDLELSFDRFPNHSLFTNLSCVKDPVTNSINKEKCKKATEVGFAQCLRPDSKKVLTKMGTQLERWGASLNTSFIYEIKNINLESLSKDDDSTENKNDEDEASPLIFTASPLCAKKTNATKSFWGGELSIETRLESAVILTPLLGIDEDLRIIANNTRFKLENSSQDQIKLVYNDEKKAWIGEKYTIASEVSHIKLPVSIPECSEDMITKGNLLKFITDNGTKMAFEDYTLEADLTDEERQGITTCNSLDVL